MLYSPHSRLFRVDYTGPLRKSRNTKCDFTQGGPLARAGRAEDLNSMSSQLLKKDTLRRVLKNAPQTKNGPSSQDVHCGGTVAVMKETPPGYTGINRETYVLDIWG